MKRNSDPGYRFNYRIEVSREMLTVLLYTPYQDGVPSKYFRFRQVEGKDFKYIDGTKAPRTLFAPGYIYPFESIKKVCDKWLQGLEG